ncbi:Vesicle transport v-SNARE protein [Tritrichomonas foetus]|uniref:Vesicle transport v-SNARE protein n=1 Tax=Tritrichomonas foetus TaxID=1144522 RepID=A0A1J4JL36_9EUKA|nr:Vesicle transport v-SNARE protein [Tritrichomonas foetus]|eukprot:OHS99127.1 Vesicle transport v-SNARE protein [Tritrichomonas foetus]
MSSSYEFYESHIQTCIDEAHAFISEAQLKSNPQKLNDARQRVDQAKATSEELKREMFLLPTNDRAAAQRRYQQILERITRLEENLQSTINRQQLMGGEYDLRRAASVDQSLARTASLGEESINIGKGILSNLSTQKDQLLGSMSNVDLINSSVSSTGRLVGKMERTQRQNKMIMWGVVVLLAVAILALFYLRYF